MWKDLIDLFQNNSDYGKLELKEKLIKIKMEKGDIIPKYFTNFNQFRDDTRSVNVIVVEGNLVSQELLGLPKSW